MNSPGVQDRNVAFSEGLAGQQQKLNAGPRGYKPNGTMQQLGYSGNGYSKKDKARQVLGSTALSGSLPTNNGSSADTAEAIRPLLNTSTSL